MSCKTQRGLIVTPDSGYRWKLKKKKKKEVGPRAEPRIFISEQVWRRTEAAAAAQRCDAAISVVSLRPQQQPVMLQHESRRAAEEGGEQSLKSVSVLFESGRISALILSHIQNKY